MATAAELRQILKEDANGQNLYEHLTNTLMQILIERPKNAFENFELISSKVKSNPLNTDPDAGKPLPLSAEQVRLFIFRQLFDCCLILTLFSLVGKTNYLDNKSFCIIKST